jgi:hypothetical protein
MKEMHSGSSEPRGFKDSWNEGKKFFKTEMNFRDPKKRARNIALALLGSAYVTAVLIYSSQHIQS